MGIDAKQRRFCERTQGKEIDHVRCSRQNRSHTAHGIFREFNVWIVVALNFDTIRNIRNLCGSKPIMWLAISVIIHGSVTEVRTVERVP